MNKRIAIACIGLAAMGTVSCKQAGKAVVDIREKHQAAVYSTGNGIMYADEIDCRAIINTTSDSSNGSAFSCYKIGFVDSTAVAQASDKKTLEQGTYHQYGIQNDWRLVKNGDSLVPVFYYPQPRREFNRNEGILVFESAPSGNDTLIYNDSFGSWETQQLIISRKK